MAYSKLSCVLGLALLLSACVQTKSDASAVTDTTSVAPSDTTDSLRTSSLSREGRGWTEVQSRSQGESPITIALVGDILLANAYQRVQLPANDGRDLFAAVKPILQNATVAAGNLEGPLADSGSSTKSGPRSFAFRMPTRYAGLLVDAGFDFVSVANNHINDMGAQGQKRTLSVLDSLQIGWAGLRDHQPYVIREIEGRRVGFCAFGQNAYCYLHREDEVVQRIVTELRPKCDILICSFHGGAEGSGANHVPEGTETFMGENRGNLRHFAHLAIDCGADIVHGHGPHVPRGIELYNDHLVAYSLGNFCTPFCMGLGGNCGYAPVLEVQLAADGTFLTGQIHSFIQQKGVGPRPDNAHRVAAEMARLSSADFPNSPLKIDEKGTILRVK